MKSTIPRIPHLPGSRLGNDDLRLSGSELALFLSEPVVVVEKLDGVALTIGFNEFDELDVAIKNDWRSALAGRVLRAARRWLKVHRELLEPLLSEPGAQLYGEWLLHRLVVPYDRLPAAVVFHSIRDGAGRLEARDRVNRQISERGLAVVEPFFRGVLGDRDLARLASRRSLFSPGLAEGMVVELQPGPGRKEVRWAKWVAPHYRQPKGKDLDGTENRISEGRRRP